jgi:protein-disulfide isomerase
MDKGGADCKSLMDKLCGDLGEATETCKLVRTKTPEFPTARCTQMLGQYDKVLTELKGIEAQNKPLDPALVAKQSGGEGPSFGPKDAKVAVVEYSDFQCPYCSRAANALNELKKAYEGKPVRFVFRQFPLSFHKEAHLAAQASLEAHAQGKFWEYHDLLFANQRALGRPQLEEYATKIGLDLAKFKAALDAGTHKAAVDADMAMGAEVGVRGTPSMMVGGTRVQNPSDVNTVKAAIDAELAKAN